MRSYTSLTLWTGILLAGILGVEAPGDEPARDQVEAEAMGQAAEADRLFKEGDFAARAPPLPGRAHLACQAWRPPLRGLRRAGDRLLPRAVGAISRRPSPPGRRPAPYDAKRDDRGFEGYDWLLIGQAQLHLDQAKAGVESLTRSLPCSPRQSIAT